MKVIVDRELCEANAVCVRQTDEVFRVEEDDTLTILMEETPARLDQSVRDAARLCPRQALRIVD